MMHLVGTVYERQHGDVSMVGLAAWVTSWLLPNLSGMMDDGLSSVVNLGNHQKLTGRSWPASRNSNSNLCLSSTRLLESHIGARLDVKKSSNLNPENPRWRTKLRSSRFFSSHWCEQCSKTLVDDLFGSYTILIFSWPLSPSREIHSFWTNQDISLYHLCWGNPNQKY